MVTEVSAMFVDSMILRTPIRQTIKVTQKSKYICKYK